VLSLNILDDPSLEQELLVGMAGVEHVPLSALATGRIESAAAAFLLPSLAFLLRTTHHCLHPWQLMFCLSSTDHRLSADECPLL
jgi:hypothetical protein